MHQHQKKGWQENVDILQMYEPKAWRMIQTTNEDEAEEVVLHMIGVLEDKLLPPLRGHK